MIGDPIAYVLCGGNGAPNLYPATVLWSNYSVAVDAIGPQIEASGKKRLFWHNPGGHHYIGWTPDPSNVHNTTQINAAIAAGIDTREMHINQWLLAEQSSCGFADRNKLKLGHNKLMRDYGVEEVIYYVGAPEVLANIERDAPLCVEMFLACGAGVSMAFDASAWSFAIIKAGDAVCRFFDSLRLRGVKVYVEPRMTQTQIDEGLGLYVDGTIATAEFDTNFAPVMNIQPGETIRGPLLPATSVPAGVTPLRNDGLGLNWGVPV